MLKYEKFIESKTFTYENQFLNEKSFSPNIMNKIESYIDRKLSKMSQKDIEKLKICMEPYKDLSLLEIENKIKNKMENNHIKEEIDNHSDLDPFGEENWDDKNEVKISLFKKAIKIITAIFLLTSVSGFFIGILLILIDAFIVNNKTFTEVSNSIFLISLASMVIYSTSKRIYKFFHHN